VHFRLCVIKNTQIHNPLMDLCLGLSIHPLTPILIVKSDIKIYATKTRNVYNISQKNYDITFVCNNLPSVLWRCWLGGRKSIRPVKNEWWGAGMVICLEWGADLHMAQLMPLPLTVSCFRKIKIGFTFLVPAHLGSSRKRAVKRVCVCVCVSYVTKNPNWD